MVKTMLNKYKGSLLVLSLFLISILAMSSVCASHNSESIIQTDDFADESMDNCQLGIEDNEDIVSENSYSEPLSDNMTLNGGTFDDIQDMVDNADDGDVIELSGNFEGTGNAIIISKNLTLKGDAVLDAKKSSGIIHFTGMSICFEGLTFINSNDIVAISSATEDEIIDNGISFSNRDNLKQLEVSFKNCVFKDNVGEYCGALHINYYSTSLTNCEFRNNKGKCTGAAVINSEDVKINGCNFIANSATWDPNVKLDPIDYPSSDIVGAVYVLGGGKCSVTDSKFTGNSAKNNDGWYTIGALDVNSNCNIKNCYFDSNKVSGTSGFLDGAGFFHAGSYCTVQDSKFINNQASSSDARGGAITELGENLLTVINCYFKDNAVKTSDHDGGAIYAYKASIKNCKFINNTASWGGAVSVYKLTIEKCSFTNNYAKQYGGAILTYDANIKNCNFSKNHAKKYGGAVYGEHSVSVKNSKFNGNVADGYGSAIGVWAEKGKISVYNCNFSKNVAKAKGSTYDYPYKNYGKGTIFHLGNLEKFKCSIKKSKGIYKNSKKFKAKTKIVASKVSKVSKGKYLTVGIKDSKGNPIKGLKLTIKIKGKTFKKTTNKKGKVKVLIKLPSKKYTAKIRFKGNNFYIKSSKTIKVVVKK